VRRALVIVATLAVGAVLAGCATGGAPPISADQLAYARSFDLYTVYWAGKSMDGIPLVQADGMGDYNPHYGVTLYYGNCEHKSLSALGGCTLPLQITTVLYVPHSNVSLGNYKSVRLRGVPAVIFPGGDEIELYTDEMSVDVLGATPKITREALAHLEPFNRPATAGWPAFIAPQFKPGVSYEQLAKEGQSTGDTGTATISPPGDLQPNTGVTQ
jgi:hypothetical protein